LHVREREVRGVRANREEQGPHDDVGDTARRRIEHE
jgi:hypothetical protein